MREINDWTLFLITKFMVSIYLGHILEEEGDDVVKWG